MEIKISTRLIFTQNILLSFYKLKLVSPSLFITTFLLGITQVISPWIMILG